MSTITRERLLNIQQWRETYGPGSNVVLPAEEAEGLARIALASLEAEPVAYMSRQKAELREKFGTCDEWDLHHQSVEAAFPSVNIPESDNYEFMPLYTAPPAPVAPDLKELEAILNWILMLPCPTPKATQMAKRLAVVMEDCRAAMLQGAEQTNHRAIVERIAEIVHGKVTDIDLLTVTVKSMKDKLHK